MLINQLIDVKADYGSGEVLEPVTLQQVRDYLRTNGFQGVEDSGEQAIDLDDELLQGFITEGRQWLEKYTGQYIVPCSLTVVLLNRAGGKELPGPVAGDIVFKDHEGETLDTIKVGASEFPRVLTPYGCNDYLQNNWAEGSQLTVEYNAGYDTFPKWVESAILAYVAFAYENRGDEQAGSPERAAAIARRYRRVPQWG